MNSNTVITRYLEFLRYCLHDDADSVVCGGTLPDCVAQINWHQLYGFAKKQSIIGVFAKKILSLPLRRQTDKTMSNQTPATDGSLPSIDAKGLFNKPTDDDVMEWMAAAQGLQRKNKAMEDTVKLVSDNFLKEGFHSCILKGQGNAAMYPSPDMRTPGDIDIWLTPVNVSATNNTHDNIVIPVIKYCRSIVPDAKICYHHIEFRKVRGTEVEVHYRPSWLNNPINNRRLQRWFSAKASECFANYNATHTYHVPTWEFNVIFQLSHIYNHILHEGIGLRQIIDYYYLLQSQPADTDTLRHDIHHLGLQPIAGAVMWLLTEVLGMSNELLICKPDKRRGELLLKEIIQGGNFGKHDHRTLSGVYSSPVKRNLQRIFRDIRMVTYFPSESISEPFFRIYHFVWRKRQNKQINRS